MQPSTTGQPKRAFLPSLPSARRASASAVPNVPTASPLPPTNLPLPKSTSTGVPAFRSLRSLLPFGPSKHATPASSAASPNISKSPFSNFGSAQRSMNRDRKASLDVSLLPVISIDRATRDELEESAMRRSVSLSRLQPIDMAQEGSSIPFQDDDDTIVLSTRGAPVLRTPSPGPPISADLSTILEADTSGMSKLPSPDDTSRAPSPLLPHLSTSFDPGQPNGADTDTSELDLSTTQLENQVLDALRSENLNTLQQWMLADKAVIFEAEELQPSFNLTALDPDLAALLRAPYRRPPPKISDVNDKNLASSSPLRSPLDYSAIELSPGPPQYALAPSPTITMNRASPLLDPLRSRLPRQQSSLPRLRPPLPPSPRSPHSPTPSTIMPSSSSSASDSTRRGEGARRMVPPSPVTTFTPASSSAPPSHAIALSPPNPSPLSASASFLSRRFPAIKAQPSSVPVAASQPASGNTIPRLRAPSTHVPHTGLHRAASTSGADHPDHSPSLSPTLSASRFTPRPSLDSTNPGSESFDQPRSSFSPSEAEHHNEYDSLARPSIDALRDAAIDSSDERTSAVALARARKRSMSVQDRLAGRLGGSVRHGPVVSEADRDDDGNGTSEFGEVRPSSSLSGRMGRRWGTRARTESENGSAPPMTEWLGPRTIKAFRAAGLLDFDPDQQPPLDRNTPGSTSGLNSGVGSTHVRYASMRSTSEYNPRAASRLALSEAGGSSASRRGSGSAVGSYGIMESPTLTTSSRDTPRSASTAPTSVSGSSFAFIGRDRDREREKEEIREMKEKHANETGALLGALSDSQRTTKVLREENGELRERLEQAEAENNALRRVVGDLTKETGDLRVQVQMFKSNLNSSTSSRLGTTGWSIPLRKSALSSSMHIDQEDDEWSSPSNSQLHNNFDVTPESHKPLNRNGKKQDGGYHHANNLELPQPGPTLSSNSGSSNHIRRFSSTSSIFPVPPANMTLLLHDQDQDLLSGGLDLSRFSPTGPAPIPLRDDSAGLDNSVASTVSISPTNFSMTTGSPGSLFLRPEHEVHLGDLDSLDLGIRRNPDTAGDDDGWSD
ncbi:hypothetical protein C0991_011246 [Blastosporella zonata]|nr:hypothetical protein C0991_011246 [Blastosporella zonata]